MKSTRTDVTRIGIDISKNVFQLHGVNRHEKVTLRKKLKREEFAKFCSELPASEIGIEACSGAHFWARQLSRFGHTVKLIAPQHVKPYVQNNKNDARDAAAICEAISRPHMKFVQAKSIQRQDMQALLRIRQELIEQRTAKVNHTRGLLDERGIVVAKKIEQIRKALPVILDENGPYAEQITLLFRGLLHGLHQDLLALDARVSELDKTIAKLVKQDEAAHRLLEIPGIGPITALALVVALGDASSFKRGRDVAAWLGLTPRQHSTGGKERLLGISKRGDKHLRTLLIHGARAVLRHAAKKADGRSRWLCALQGRRNFNIAAVALANKNARIVWAMLRNDAKFDAAKYAKGTDALLVDAGTSPAQ